MRHILVNNKAKADELESQLKAGANFAKLAKKYSKDTLSAVKGGKLTIEKGQTVAEFDKAAFALKTNEISPPMQDAVRLAHHPGALRGQARARRSRSPPSRRRSGRTWSARRRRTSSTKWLDGVKKEFAKSVRYQTGYMPEATTTTTAATHDRDDRLRSWRALSRPCSSSSA